MVPFTPIHYIWVISVIPIHFTWYLTIILSPAGQNFILSPGTQIYGMH